MAVIIVAVLLTVLNLALWGVLLARFKKMFSTDGIIEDAREKLDAMLADINRQTDRNISLLEDRIQRAKDMMAEADSRLEAMKSDLGRVEKAMKAELGQAEKARLFQGRLAAAEDAPPPEEKPRARRVRAPLAMYQQEQQQGGVPAKEAGPAQPAAEVPQVVKAERPIVPKKDFKQEVKKFAAQGMTVEEIAAKVGRSTQEIEFALEFS